LACDQGCVGAYFGGHLAESGQDVAFLARGDHLRAIRERGLQVTSIAGDLALHPVRASDDPAELGPTDAILVAVKTWQVAEAAESLRPLLGPDTFAVPLMNGPRGHTRGTDA
jgi:2-dehydropantoate 2-reductase